VPKGAIPLEFYEEYWQDLPTFPDPVVGRLKTFFALVGFDPYDEGLLAVCQTRYLRWRRVYGYPLSDGFVVFWRVKQEVRFRFKGEPEAPQVYVAILAIARP